MDGLFPAKQLGQSRVGRPVGLIETRVFPFPL